RQSRYGALETEPRFAGHSLGWASCGLSTPREIECPRWLDSCHKIVRILTMSKTRAEAEHATNERDRAATLQLVIAVGRALSAIERVVRTPLAASGLAMTEFAVLEVLYHKGPLRLGEIRDRILVTGASTTYVVKKLEERGLMRRKDLAEDSRVVLGELTAKGRALIE